MRATLSSREYGPELVVLMGDALDSAWQEATASTQDAELARLVMASAILDKVDAGVRESQQLVMAAVAALRAAISVSRGDAGLA